MYCAIVQEEAVKISENQVNIHLKIALRSPFFWKPGPKLLRKMNTGKSRCRRSAMTGTHSTWKRPGPNGRTPETL
jgi:hypothetical protein